MHRQFESTKQQFQRRLYSYAYYSLRIAADAEDVVQEAFVKLWENWHDIDPPQVGPWLMRVTRNLVVDQVRRRNARLPLTDIDADDIAQESDSEPDQLQQRSLKRMVEESIAKLNDPYRSILIMREIQGLGYQEIADILGITLGHAKSDLFRAKRKLREIVSKHPLYHHDLLMD